MIYSRENHKSKIENTKYYKLAIKIPENIGSVNLPTINLKANQESVLYFTSRYKIR